MRGSSKRSSSQIVNHFTARSRDCSLAAIPGVWLPIHVAQAICGIIGIIRDDLRGDRLRLHGATMALPAVCRVAHGIIRIAETRAARLHQPNRDQRAGQHCDQQRLAPSLPPGIIMSW